MLWRLSGKARIQGRRVICFIDSHGAALPFSVRVVSLSINQPLLVCKPQSVISVSLRGEREEEEGGRGEEGRGGEQTNSMGVPKGNC